jgi:uncharacterized protein (TIGR04255 family)
MADKDASDPVFDYPPVIETVLGVQFAPLKDFTAAHAGWFWKTNLDSKWEKVAETIALPDEFERFDTAPAGPSQLRIGPVSFPGRLQISHANDGRMLQIQPTRFHYNWNRIGGEYPRYHKVLEEFDRHFAAFCHFVGEARLGEVVPNQWELTYIDSIPRGALWKTPADWSEILPGLFSAPVPVASVRLESFGGEWHFEIPPQRGRLHVTVQSARVGDDPTPVLLLQSTARGPIGPEGVSSVKEGLELGHQAAVDLFVGITSGKAQAAWGRKT